MWKWLRRQSGVTDETNAPALRGAPIRARTKTYSAEAGYVYQYVYSGFLQDGAAITFVFKVTSDRVHTTQVAIRLEQAHIVAAEQKIGRTLLPQERYAIAKLSLFAAFDTAIRDNPVTPDRDQMYAHLQTLGRA